MAPKKPDAKPFWETKPLEDMSREEWESLCDGCAKCCLIKLEDEDTGEIALTRLQCKLLDSETCRCSDYEFKKDHKIVAFFDDFEHSLSEESLWQISESIKPRHVSAAAAAAKKYKHR